MYELDSAEYWWLHPRFHTAKQAVEAAIPLSIGKVYKGPGATEACMADLIVKAAVKEALNDMNVASDFYDALDDEAEELLEDAARRAEENDRKTVQPRDL
jgi:nucleotide-binding universal stress UspA family protein